jgi:hypothetical protein
MLESIERWFSEPLEDRCKTIQRIQVCIMRLSNQFYLQAQYDPFKVDEGRRGRKRSKTTCDLHCIALVRTTWHIDATRNCASASEAELCFNTV